MTARPLKSLFIALNLAIAMALFLVGHSVLDGMTRSITRGVEALGSDAVMIGDRTNDFVNARGGTGIDEDDLAVMRDIFGSRYTLTGAARSFGEVAVAGKVQSVPVYYIDRDFFSVTRVSIEKGRAFDERESREGAAVCLVSETLADALEIGASVIAAEGVDCRVVGIVSAQEVIPGQSLERAVYRPRAAMFQHSSGGSPSLSTIYLRNQAGRPPEADLARMREYTALANPERGDMVWSGEQYWDARERISRNLTILITAITLLLIAMASTSLANSLLLDVMTRRMEIGLRMALGATPRDILALVAFDGGRTALSGGLAGIAAAAGLIILVLKPLLDGSDLLPGTELELGFKAIVLSFGVLTIAAAAAIAVPAIRATRIDPSLTLRNL